MRKILLFCAAVACACGELIKPELNMIFEDKTAKIFTTRTGVKTADDFFAQRAYTVACEYINAQDTQGCASDLVGRADAAAYVKKNAPRGESWHMARSYELRFLYQRENLLTFFEREEQDFVGAEHGSYNEKYYVYDLNNGKFVKFADLAKGDLDALFRIIKNKAATLVAQPSSECDYACQAQNAEEAADRNFNLNDAGAREDLLNYASFYYGKTGMVFASPSYSAAGFRDGMTEIEVPFSELKDVVKSEYLRGYF